VAAVFVCVHVEPTPPLPPPSRGPPDSLGRDSYRDARRRAAAVDSRSEPQIGNPDRVRPRTPRPSAHANRPHHRRPAVVEGAMIRLATATTDRRRLPGRSRRDDRSRGPLPRMVRTAAPTATAVADRLRTSRPITIISSPPSRWGRAKRGLHTPVVVASWGAVRAVGRRRPYDGCAR
jgi:hypothetical protein